MTDYLSEALSDAVDSLLGADLTEQQSSAISTISQIALYLILKNNQQQITPCPGEYYQHIKHDPIRGYWHRYRIDAIVFPIADPGDNLSSFYRHTETGSLHRLSQEGLIRYSPDLAGAHIAYSNIDFRLCDLSWIRCLRPIDGFSPDKFERILDLEPILKPEQLTS